ncbi:MAG: hypothetical protein ABEN55_15105, partial [Bradymonadaceae bacterium]
MTDLGVTWENCAASGRPKADRGSDAGRSMLQPLRTARTRLEADAQKEIAQCRRSAAKSLATVKELVGKSGALCDGLAIAMATTNTGPGAAVAASAPLSTPLMFAAGAFLTGKLIS